MTVEEIAEDSGLSIAEVEQLAVLQSMRSDRFRL